MNRLDITIRCTTAWLTKLQTKLKLLRERNERHPGFKGHSDNEIRLIEADIAMFQDRLQTLLNKRDALTPSFSSIPEVEQFLQAWKIWALGHYHTQEQTTIPAKYRHDSMDQLHDILDREVERKRKDIYLRCYEAVGHITHSSNLRVSTHPYLSIGGILTGEKGAAIVQTVASCRSGDMAVVHSVRVRRIG